MGDLLFRTIGALVRIETVLEKDLWRATADPSQIEFVILNLAVMHGMPCQMVGA